MKHRFDLNDWTREQRETLVDLMLLGMYRDGHLAVQEDDRIAVSLEQLGIPRGRDQDLLLDAGTIRVRRHLGSGESVQGFVKMLPAVFTDAGLRRDAVAALEEVVRSDGVLAADEEEFLSLVRAALEVRS